MNVNDAEAMANDVSYRLGNITTELMKLYIEAYEAGKKAAEEAYKGGDHEN